jgi:hypothetical protein
MEVVEAVPCSAKQMRTTFRSSLFSIFVENIASLTMSARVKHSLSALLHALKEERHFALVEGFAFPTVGSLVIVSGQEFSPTHASLRSATAIMITTSNSSLKRSKTPNQ